MSVKIILVLQNTDKQKSGSTTESLYILLLIPQKNFNCKAQACLLRNDNLTSSVVVVLKY